MPTIQIRTPEGFTPACTAKLDVGRSTRCSSVVLPAGTRLKIDPEDYQSHPQPNFGEARRWIADGIVQVLREPQDDGAHLILLVEHACSLSAAAVLVRGKSGSGVEWWVIDEQNHRFKGQRVSNLLSEGDRRQGANAGKAAEPPGAAEPPKDDEFERHLPLPFAALVDPNNSQLHSTSQPEFYKGVVDAFTAVNKFKRIDGEDAWNAEQWPETSGVYAVWRTSENKVAELLYVGMTGKSNRDGTMNGGHFSARLHRWIPYCFQSDGIYTEHFEYGPNPDVSDVRELPYADRYQHHVPAKEIRVDCFSLNGMERRMAPALLEALLLQHHLAIYECLPPANNEF